MEKRINIAELLKDCPTGMELDCAMWDDVKFDKIETKGNYPIRVQIGGDIHELFTEFGQWNHNDKAKCVIYPKGKTTWEGFHRPFKDGDILVGKANQPFIFQSFNRGNGCISYCGIDTCELFHLYSDDWTFANSLRFATEEEKEKLFQSIKDNGYKWNAETKILEKLAEPKFNVGDKVRPKNQHEVRLISEVRDNYYLFDGKNIPLPFSAQDDWELAPNKFDLSTLVPFESKVLVRTKNFHDKWIAGFFSHKDSYEFAPFWTTADKNYQQCIPYEGNEHLLNTTDDCDEYYKTWEN